MSDHDDSENPMVVLGFASIDDLINFIDWVNENFDDPEELRTYFENTVQQHILEYKQCERTEEAVRKYKHCCDIDDCDLSFVTSSGLKLHKRVAHGVDPDMDFWNIINNSYKNHHKEIRDHLRNSD